MNPTRRPLLPRRRPATPRRPGARWIAVLAAAGVCTALAVATAAAGSAQPPASSTAHPAATDPATRTVTLATTLRRAAASPSPSPAPSPSPQPVPAGGTGSCALLDVSCDAAAAITGWFAALVTSAASPLLTLIGQSALSTPQPGSVPAVHAMWATSLAVADACYVLLVLLGAVLVMSHETVQSSYSVKEIAPRVVLGFTGANLSMVVISQAVTLANSLSSALEGQGVTPASAAASLITTLEVSASGGNAFLVLLALAGVVLALVLAVVYVIRMMAVVLLAAAAPIALALYALPQTAWAARWWWRALTAALSVQVAQSLVLTAAVKVFLTPGWLPWQPGYLEQDLIVLCLLYVLMRIPFWVARPVLSPFGHSPLRRAARFAVTAAVLSRVAPLLRGSTKTTARPARTKGKGP